MRVDITPKEIRAGQRGEPKLCSLALGITRALGAPVQVGAGNVYDSQLNVCAILPHVAHQFLIDFDSGKKVYPFSFELELI